MKIDATKQKGGVEVGERCEGVVEPKEKTGGHSSRCPNAATHVLMNGEHPQGKVCDAHARSFTTDFKFVTARPLSYR